jgi:hypothetical protein
MCTKKYIYSKIAKDVGKLSAAKFLSVMKKHRS